MMIDLDAIKNMDDLKMVEMTYSGDLDKFKKYCEHCSSGMIQKTFHSAVYNGKMETIKYMLDNGYIDVSSQRYCDLAARRGHYECMVYLHENGCPFGKYTGLIAMIREDTKSLMYIMKNGGSINYPPE